MSLTIEHTELFPVYWYFLEEISPYWINGEFTQKITSPQNLRYYYVITEMSRVVVSR
jgi:hypothetical protein